MAVLVGVDIGGTNTDLIMMESATGEFRVAKVPTVVGDQAEGLIAGIGALELKFDSIDLLIHGTTIATNAVIERKGARCGLITTHGFRDVLELRRRDRPFTYGLGGAFRPLIDRQYRLEIPERILADGTTHTPLDEEALMEAVAALKAKGCECLVISFINAYANPAHEQRAKALAAELWDRELIITSSDILPTIREFERTSTAVVSGYVTPVISRYLRKLGTRLHEGGYGKELMVVQSNGGVMTAATAARRAGNTLLSGPAAGVSAARMIASDVAESRAISADIGGTSMDICVIKDGRAAMTQEKQLEFGIPLALPMLDVDAIGIGGGSFARLDGTGLLTVGPESAGADPGPACYGRGNDVPTLTDANLVVGLLDPDRAIGKNSGTSMNRDLARKAIDEHVAGPLGLSVEDAAEAILRIAGARAAGHIRKKLMQNGLDPREFSVIAFGGGGPLLANRLMREAELRRSIIPAFPGIASAMGCLIGNLQHDFMRSAKIAVRGADKRALQGIFADDMDAARQLLLSEGIAESEIEIELGADMSYRGQSNTLLVSFGTRLEDVTEQSVTAAFEAVYKARFGRLLPDAPIVIVNARTVARQSDRDISLSRLFRKEDGVIRDPGRTRVYFSGVWLDVDLHDRHTLPRNAKVTGPCILHQVDTTLFVEPGYACTVHESGNILLEKSE